MERKSLPPIFLGVLSPYPWGDIPSSYRYALYGDDIAPYNTKLTILDLKTFESFEMKDNSDDYHYEICGCIFCTEGCNGYSRLKILNHEGNQIYQSEWLDINQTDDNDQWQIEYKEGKIVIKINEIEEFSANLFNL